MNKPFYFKDDFLFINVLLKPASSRNAIIGVLDGYLKIQLTSQPIDGKANKHLIEFLSKEFKTAKTHIKIVKGELNPQKLIRITQFKTFPIAFKDN